MNAKNTYDIVIIGAGPAGYPAALRATRLGANVAIVEREAPGGTCLNRGCIPTKYLIKQTAEGNTDWQSLISGKNELVAGLVEGIRFLWDKMGVTVIEGTGRIIGSGKVLVDSGESIELSAEKGVLYAPGSVSMQIPSLSVDGEIVVDSDDLLERGGDFDSCAIIGGGAIGLEWASLLTRTGTEVTVIEMMPQALPGLDGDVAKRLVAAMKKNGIQFKLNTAVKGIDIKGDKVVINLGDDVEEEFDRVLVAVGRSANINSEELGKIGIDIENRRISIDGNMRTSLPNVYAAGDAAGIGPMLAHLATKQGLVAVDNILNDRGKTVNYDAVPWAVFTEPECAGVGITSIQAGERGFNVKEGRMDYRTLGRPTADGNTFGFIKVVGDEGSGKLLGCHALGYRSSEVVQVASAIITSGGDVEDLADVIATHPTYTELLQEAAEDWLGLAIHKI
ncbi:MAG: NAD(P)/FAD-dependent oxidoreductase [bacterium]|nr:NAD(P)/FAD-dependent oxidoreductase [bacterium]